MPGIVAFARWDPFRDFLTIQHRLERLSTGPQGWNPAGVAAEMHDGVLTITVPKAPDAGPRRVEVS